MWIFLVVLMSFIFKFGPVSQVHFAVIFIFLLAQGSFNYYKWKQDSAQSVIGNVVNDQSGNSPLLSYLVVVVIAHLGTITIALKGGGLSLVALWFYGAIPFFIPGFFVGIACLLGAVSLPKRPVNPLKMLLGILVIALPFYEWHLLATLPSGYLAR